MSQSSVASHLLQTLSAFGVDCIFANPGSEFIPIIDAYESLKKEGVRIPRAVTVPHEATAMAMAYGYYLATGRPQAVFVHVTVGTANALIGLIGAAHMQIPILFLAGRTPITESGQLGSRDRFVHWAQESFDQGSMTREFVKWDYEIRLPESLQPALNRAWSLMQSAPKGPVSLIFPREILYKEGHAEISSHMPSAVERVSPAGDVMDQFSRILMQSERALLITSRSGMNQANVNLLESAAERHGLAVLCPQAHAMNISSEHPQFVGYLNSQAIREADLIIVLDTDVPWLSSEVVPNTNAHIVHIGADPLFSRIPMRDFTSTQGTTLNVVAEPELFLRALTAVPSGVESSRLAWTQRHHSYFLTNQQQLMGELEESSHLTPHSVALALNQILDSDTVLLNELSLPPDLLKLLHPGGYWRSGSASGLGWALGCALGIKMAAPKKVVISVLGDGVYYLSQPLAVQWVAAAQDLPTLIIVLNNEGMPSIHKSPVFTSLKPSLAFADMARAGGAQAWRVFSRTELSTALLASVASVRAGKTAFIEVCL